MGSRHVEIDYTNYRGERALRVIEPTGIRFGTNDYHTERQWLLDAFDVEKGAGRSFALADVHSWRPFDVERIAPTRPVELDEHAHDAAVRRSERLRLADLFDGHAETLGGFARQPEQVVRLIAFMLRLDGDTPEVPARHACGGHLIDAAELHAADPRWHVECSGCGWYVDAPRSEALAAGKEHESLNPVSIR